MISDIRSYLDVQVKAIDPDLIPWDEDLFGNNDVNNAEIEKYYNVIFGPLTNTRDSNNFTDNVPVQLDIWACLSNDAITDYNTLYDKAILIKNCIIYPVNVNDPLYGFNDIELVSIEPIEELTSDKTFKMRLSFIVRNSFKF